MDHLEAHHVWALLGSLVVIFATSTLWKALFGPLARVPVAHWTCRFSGWWFVSHDVYDLHKLHQLKGPLIRYGPNRISVASLEGFQTIYGSHNSPFLKDRQYYLAFMPDPHSWSVFTMNDPDKHKARRLQMSPMFARQNLLSMEPLFKEKAKLVVGLLQKRAAAGHASNSFYAFRCMTMDVITPLAWGKCMGALEASSDFNLPVLRALDEQSHSVHARNTYPYFFFVLKKLVPFRFLPENVKNFERLIEEAGSYYDVFFKNREAHRATEDTKLLFQLLQTDKAGLEMERNQAVAESLITLVAGADTTGHTIACMCWALSIGVPEVGKKLTQELMEALPEEVDLDHVSLQFLEGLPYLSAVIHEGIRWCDASSGLLARVVPPGGTVIDSTYLPAKTSVAASSVYIHRNETLFEHAEQYQPARWLDENGQFQNSLNKHIAQFGKGSRQCIGKGLAIAEMYVTMAWIYRTCVVKAAPTTPLQLEFSEVFTGTPKNHDLPLYFHAM